MTRYLKGFMEIIRQLRKLWEKVTELNEGYLMPKSTIDTWLKDNSKVSIDGQVDITVKELRILKKEIAQIKDENKILKKPMAIIIKK